MKQCENTISSGSETCCVRFTAKTQAGCRTFHLLLVSVIQSRKPQAVPRNTNPASADLSICASCSISRFRSSNRRSIVQHSRKKRMVHKNKQNVKGKANGILDSTSTKQYLGNGNYPEHPPLGVMREYIKAVERWKENGYKPLPTHIKTGISCEALAVKYLKWAEIEHRNAKSQFYHCKVAAQLLIDHCGKRRGK